MESPLKPTPTLQPNLEGRGPDLNVGIEKLSHVGMRNFPRLKKLGIATVRDLLWHLPARYEDFSRMIPIADVQPDEKVHIQGEVVKIDSRHIFPRRMTVTTAIVKDDSGAIKAVWFNQPYIENTLTEGTRVSLAGTVKLSKHGLQLSSPTYEKLRGDEFSPPPAGGLTHTEGLVPVYPETEGITSKYLRFLIKPILEEIKINDPLPDEVLDRNQLINLEQAIHAVHYPKTVHEAEEAKERLAFDDLLLFQIKALLERRKMNQLKSVPVEFDQELVKDFIARLPFELTKDQKVAAWEILKDLEKSYPMNRLMEGDVGSGKTVVALIAAIQVAKAGYQTVFMAPTEVLANQHMETISSLISNFQFPISKQTPNSKSENAPTEVALLTASNAWSTYSLGKKADIKKRIASGQAKIIIGTHALIQKDVRFANLAMVVIDEQHRFGVNQRKTLVRGSTQIETPIDADNGLLYEDLTYKIRGAFYNVYNKLGPGHKEIVYHKALLEELASKNLKFSTEKSIPIKYLDKKVGEYKPDIVVDDKIIIEIKAIPFLGKTEEKQLWSYLRGSDYKVAMLVNFGNQELQIKRVVYDTARNQRKSASLPRESALQVRIPHLLSMTATPIPRTLALTIYGDLDISIIKEKPKNRQKIITKVINPADRTAAYQFVRAEVKKGRQVFVICPRIEDPRAADQRGIDADNRGKISVDQRDNPRKSASAQMKFIWAEMKAVEEEYKKLSELIFPDLKVMMLHGKMPAKEKQKIMDDFKSGKGDILVSTSVIEVGVDIPNATVMVIENADRFGLAQLHQFRGRIGRDIHQSTCLLFATADNQTVNKRLKALVDSDDGFLLAEKDMAIRGPGSFFGTEQSGLPDLAMAALSNVELIKKARVEARTLLKADPSLKKYPLLTVRLERFQKLTHFE